MTEDRYVAATGRLPLTAIYDRAIALTVREQTFRPAVVRAATVDRVETMLDVGCGTGTLAIALAVAAPQAAVTGPTAILQFSNGRPRRRTAPA